MRYRVLLNGKAIRRANSKPQLDKIVDELTDRYGYNALIEIRDMKTGDWWTVE